MIDVTTERILVTGGNGFLGPFVVRRLEAKGAAVFAPRSGVYDLTEESACKAAFAEYNPTIVVHLAAYCGGIGLNAAQPYEMAAVNLRLAENITACSLLWNVKKLVALGSVCAYPKFCSIPFKESDLFAGYPEETNAPYGMAKRALWSLLDAAHREHGLASAFLVPANLYGPSDNFRLSSAHVIPAMIRKFCYASQNGDATVTLWGTGEPTREFLFVDDCAEAIVRAVEVAESPEPINIGTGRETKVSDLSELIRSLVGYRGAIKFDSLKPDGQPRRCLDVSRARSELQWEARTPLELGLRLTLAWYIGA